MKIETYFDADTPDGQISIRSYGDLDGERQEIAIWLNDDPAEFASALEGIAGAVRRRWGIKAPPR